MSALGGLARCGGQWETDARGATRVTHELVGGPEGATRTCSTSGQDSPPLSWGLRVDA